MSFSQDIRASGGFNRQFGREKRRIQLSEIPKSDIDTMQQHVVEIRTYAHFVDLVNSLDNISSVPTGPNDYYFEPDYSTVKLRSNFGDVGGIGTEEFHTLNGVNYYSLELYDQASTNSRLWYSVCQDNVGTTDQIFDTDKLWEWNVGFHPTSIKQGNSIRLNAGTGHTKEMLYVSNLASNFNFTAQRFSMGFWIYPTELDSVSGSRVVAHRFIDASNEWAILIDPSDNILYAVVEVAGVATKRQYSTPLTTDNWYFVCITWNTTGPVLTLKVNDAADAATTKIDTTGSTVDGLYFGSYPGAAVGEDFAGYFTGLTYYQHGTVLTSGEMTSLYTYNTKSAITEPFTWGYGQYG